MGLENAERARTHSPRFLLQPSGAGLRPLLTKALKSRLPGETS